MNNDVFINGENQEILVNEDEEESESIVYYEYGAHFKYNDLYKNLLKIKQERDKNKEENERNNIINNNIIINNNLNLNLFNNNRHKIVSRNLQENNYMNNIDIVDNSNTFISNLAMEQLNKTAILPSSEIMQQKIDDYFQNLEKNKLIKNAKPKFRNNNNQSNKIKELDKPQKDENKVSNIKGNLNKSIRQRNNYKENININLQKMHKTYKKNKSPEKNAINLKKRKNNMITLSFKYSKNTNINNIIFKKIKEVTNYKNYGNWTKQLLEKMAKTKTKTKTKSKSKSNSKKAKKKVYGKTNNIKIYNKIKKFTEKNTAYVSHQNFNNKTKKDISQNFTTKIINKYKRANKFFNHSNYIESRRAHSSSLSKNEKYNLNSLIHNTKIYNKMNESRNKSPSDKLKQISKSHLYDTRNNKIITLNNCNKNKSKQKTKNQLLRNSFNIYSIGISVAKTRDSNVNSEVNFSKSNSKNKKKLKSNKNMKLNHPNKKGYNTNNFIFIKPDKKSFNQKQKSNKKIMNKIKTSSPYNNICNSKGLKKKDSDLNNKANKNNNNLNNAINIDNKISQQDNKSLDSQKLHFKNNKSKKKDSSTSAKKNIGTKNKNKILSRNIGGNNINNYLIKNYTNIKFNTKEIFNNKLSNLTINNINKIKEQISRNIFNNLNSFSGKMKKSNIMNNTNSFLNNHDYLRLVNNMNKNKGSCFTNNNNSDYLKKGIILNGSKSKNNIYLKNNIFNKPVKKLNKKKK